MSNREYATAILNEISDEQLEDVIEALSEYVDRGTIMRLESMAFCANPNPKTYKNFREFLEQLEADV